jgi:hypothetical protein
MSRITKCNKCKHLEVRQTYSESLYYCSKEGGKKIEYSGTLMTQPDWCPLKIMRWNKFIDDMKSEAGFSKEEWI